MRDLPNNQYLRTIRALALVISEQSLIVRQVLKSQLLSRTEDLVIICQQSFQQINWTHLLQHKLELHGVELDNALCLFESSYPVQLQNIQDPPWILFYKGANPSLLESKKCIAIVGSRKADYSGLELAEDFAFILANEGLTIVSGMALGIDAAAHKGAIRSNTDLNTVAVLGSGLNVIYPSAHKQLFTEIVKTGGTVLSQFEPNTAPYPSNFLNRNRTVAGLCCATLVIQATLRSGSLVTARHSVEQGKDVYVIPGDIDNRRYEGSNRLIQQGAELITGIEDLMQHLDLTVNAKTEHSKVEAGTLSDTLQSQIISILEDEGQVKVDAMVRKLGCISFEKELLELEISGQIERLPGNVLKWLR